MTSDTRPNAIANAHSGADYFMLDLRTPGDAVIHVEELRGKQPTTPTKITLTRSASNDITLHVRCADPDMASRIVCTSPANTDPFLYEEDAVQVAVAMPRDHSPAGFMLINSAGTQNATGIADAWKSNIECDDEGWSLSVTLSLPDTAAANANADTTFGLSVFRFFRGLRHEAIGPANTLPHPLDVRRFDIVVLQGESMSDAAANHIAAATAAVETEVAARAGQAAFHIARNSNQHRATLDTAITLADRRADETIEIGARYLCWNEGHYQQSLIDLYHLTEDPRWIERCIARVDSVFDVRASNRNVSDRLRGRPLPTWYNADGDLCMCLITGKILDAIARLMLLVDETPALDRFREKTRSWLPDCQAAIEVHDIEWVALPDGSGNYLEPYEKGDPSIYGQGGSRLCPMNRFAFLAMPMLRLAKMTDNDVWFDRVKRMAKFFRMHCDELPHGGLTWEYEVTPYPATGEDLSHAVCQVHFAELCAAEGIVWTEADVARIAITLDETVFQHGDVPIGSIRQDRPGLYTEVAAWSSLCRFRPKVLTKIEAIMEAKLGREMEATGQLDCQGWAVRLLTLLEYGKRGMPAV